MLLKITKVRKIWHLCCKLNEFHPTFSPIAFWILYCFNAQVIGSFVLQKRLWFEQKFWLVCQRTCFFDVSPIFGSFRGQFQQKLPLSLQTAYWRYADYSLTSFLHPFVRPSSSKILQNLPKFVKELGISQYNFPIFGSFWGKLRP